MPPGDEVRETPQRRGSTLIMKCAKPSSRGHPARTGVYPPRTRRTNPATRSPRTRGGLPPLGDQDIPGNAVTPHARGSTSRRPAPQERSMGHPARAGVYPRAAVSRAGP